MPSNQAMQWTLTRFHFVCLRKQTAKLGALLIASVRRHRDIFHERPLSTHCGPSSCKRDGENS